LVIIRGIRSGAYVCNAKIVTERARKEEWMLGYESELNKKKDQGNNKKAKFTNQGTSCPEPNGIQVDDIINVNFARFNWMCS
jgi:hypothetical protein